MLWLDAQDEWNGFRKRLIRQVRSDLCPLFRKSFEVVFINKMTVLLAKKQKKHLKRYFPKVHIYVAVKH